MLGVAVGHLRVVGVEGVLTYPDAMSNVVSRSRTLALSALAALALTAGLAACTESPEETAATSTTTTTLPDNVPSVAWVWANPEESTGEDVRVPVYASIQGGTEADELTGVKVDPELAASAEIVPADDAPVALPATTTVNLSEDTVHIELVGLEEPLEYNRAFEITLEFAKADDLKVQGQVRNPTDPAGTD
jgi:copper(I)-binding protein